MTTNPHDPAAQSSAAQYLAGLDGSASDESLVTLLRRLTVESDRFAGFFGEAHGLYRTDLNALVIIMDMSRSEDTPTQGRLATELNLSASATTALLDRLEEAGHVYRRRGERDRRRVEVCLHEQARSLGQEFFAPLGAAMSEAWETFDTRDRRVIADFLTASIDATVRVRRGI